MLTEEAGHVLARERNLDNAERCWYGSFYITYRLSDYLFFFFFLGTGPPRTSPLFPPPPLSRSRRGERPPLPRFSHPTRRSFPKNSPGITPPRRRLLQTPRHPRHYHLNTLSVLPGVL